MGNITSDILAISFDSPSSPTITLNVPDQPHGTHSFGWGVAWYPQDARAALVKKDPRARGTSVVLDSLSDWAHYRSTIYFTKSQGAAQGYTHHETQPFSRSFAGQDWIFMHNGDLNKTALQTLLSTASRLLEPVGTTDSELAFCFLLSRMQETSARRISDVEPAELYRWCLELDALGSADFCLSDGITLACFYGSQSERALLFSRLEPHKHAPAYHMPSATLEFNDPRDTYRTAFVVTSSLFTEGSWQHFEPQQLLLIRGGAVIWDSTRHAASMPTAAAPITRATMPQSSVMNIRSITHTPSGEPLTYRRYDVLHRTTYRYHTPVEHSTHTFRLHPVEDPSQQVVRAVFSVSVPGEEIRYEDVFGNSCIHYSINIPYTELVIECESTINVYATAPDDHSLSRRQTSLPLVWMPWQRQMIAPYILPPELPDTELRELYDYGMSYARRNGFHLMATLKDMNNGIYRDFTYMPGTTSLYTTPFEVYASRRGVCQDFANLFICIARLLSIPARYRMGYIHTGANYSNKIQSEASHAWVEIYLPYVGWRGFDPTNGCLAGQDHVRVACGRNYMDATPTSGTIYRGGAGELLSVEVNIQETVAP